MEKILNFILAMLFGCWMTISGMSHETIVKCEWIGIAIGLGAAYFICSHNSSKIDKLEKEINKLKKDNEQNI